MVTSAEPAAHGQRVERFIAEQVGDVGRPLAGLPITADLRHLPGDSSAWAGIRNIIGMGRYGVAHVVERAARQPPIYRDRFGPIAHVAVRDPDLIAAIARNEDGVWSTALAWRFFFEGLAASPTIDSPVALDFQPHKDLRRFLQPAFKADAMADYVAAATQMFGAAVDRWLRCGRVSFKAEVRRLLANVASKIFIGVDDSVEAEFLDQAMIDFWRAPLALTKHAWLSPTWRRAQRGYARLFEAMRARVPERRTNTGTDLLTRMCQNNEQIEWMDDDALVRAFLGVMAAAFDTTSMGVTSMAYALATHPEWQRRLRTECAQVPGNASYAEIKKLREHEWVWKETLRLYPVANALPRRPLRDVMLGGQRIPAGAFVLALLTPAMRDPRLWTHPERFDPERFAPERAEDTKCRGAFLPFGAGAHACIGARLSTVEAIAFWHTMLSRCRFRLARPYRARHEFRPLGVVSGDVELIVEPLRE